MLGRTAAVVTLSLALPWVIACSSRDSPDHIPGGASAGSSVSSSGANTTAATTGGGGDGSGPVPNEADLPVPYGTCPVFINGKNSVTIAGLPTRGVELRYTTASQAKNGPLVIIWRRKLLVHHSWPTRQSRLPCRRDKATAEAFRDGR